MAIHILISKKQKSEQFRKLASELGIDDLKYIPDEEQTEEEREEIEKRFRDGFVKFLRKQKIDNENNQ